MDGHSGRNPIDVSRLLLTKTTLTIIEILSLGKIMSVKIPKTLWPKVEFGFAFKLKFGIEINFKNVHVVKKITFLKGRKWAGESSGKKTMSEMKVHHVG